MMKPCYCSARIAFAYLLASATPVIAQSNNITNTDELDCLTSLWKTTDYAGASRCLDDLIVKANGAIGTNSELTPSYALGIRFQREVASEFPQLSYLQFLKGSLDEASTKTHFSNEEVTTSLKEVLLSPTERSAKRVRDFSLKSGVNDWNGIYYIDRTSASTKQSHDADSCSSTVGKERTYLIDYQRLLQENDKPDLDNLANQCLYFDNDEIIRGWRTALKKMEENDVWEILIPPALAYGEDGIESDNEHENVEPSEALHFVIRLREKS